MDIDSDETLNICSEDDFKYNSDYKWDDNSMIKIVMIMNGILMIIYIIQMKMMNKIYIKNID